MITHLACVMDGNRRWAKQQGFMSWQGHQAGARTVEIVIKFCLQYKIRYLSLYTFSLENFNRSLEERSYLFDMIVEQTKKSFDLFIQEKIKVCFIGDLSKFPEHVQKACHEVQEQTAYGNLLQVNFLFGYGARQEILSAAQLFTQRVKEGMPADQRTFESCFWTAGIPDPDLIIRTGGMQRLSNFLLYQSAYTEIFFLETLWPDLQEIQLLHAVQKVASVQKNLGK